jgi:hypothetical protein
MSSFLGLVSYYRDYIKGCSSIAELLQEMVQLTPSEYPKEPSDKQKAAFAQLCDALTDEDCVLIKPDFNKPFILQTDASNYGLGAVLTQRDTKGKERVISYASRTLLKAKRKWHTHELEALAALWGYEHFRPYLIGRKFLLETDHHLLQWLRNERRPGRLERWVLRLAEYDFDIRHRPGKDNGNEDGPSCNPIEYDPDDEEKLRENSEALRAEPFSFHVCEHHRRRRAWQKNKLDEKKETEQLQAFFLLDAALMAQQENPAEVFRLESDFFRRVFREAQREDPWCKEILKVIESPVENGDRDPETPLETKWRKVYALNRDGILVCKQAWLKNRETKELYLVCKGWTPTEADAHLSSRDQHCKGLVRTPVEGREDLHVPKGEKKCIPLKIRSRWPATANKLYSEELSHGQEG